MIAFGAVCALAAMLLILTSGTSGSVIKRATVTAPAILGQTSSVPQTTSSDGSTDCGGVTQTDSDGSPMTCTFDDEFDGTTLNTGNWTVVTTASNGYHSGSECYENSPNNVNVAGGTLNLTLIKGSNFVCKEPVGMGQFTTAYTAGSVNTLNKFSQTYGYFEVKAKFPAATVKGLQTSIWLWPVNSCAYGCNWPASGELDIAEWYSQYPTLAVPYIHYNPKGGKSADPNITNNNCAVANENAYNTYAVSWTPTTITIYMDGQMCLTDNWNPAAPEVKPAPFNLPFFVNLTAAMGVVTNAPTTTTAKELPATSNIDYVRVWG